MGRPTQPTATRSAASAGPTTTSSGSRDYAMRRPRSPEEREKFALLAASDAGGRLTTSQLSLMTQLALSESKEVLDHLHQFGACELEVDGDTGMIVYVFPDFLDQQRMSGSETASRSRLDDDLDAI